MVRPWLTCGGDAFRCLSRPQRVIFRALRALTELTDQLSRHIGQLGAIALAPLRTLAAAVASATPDNTRWALCSTARNGRRKALEVRYRPDFDHRHELEQGKWSESSDQKDGETFDSGARVANILHGASAKTESTDYYRLGEEQRSQDLDQAFRPVGGGGPHEASECQRHEEHRELDRRRP